MQRVSVKRIFISAAMAVVSCLLAACSSFTPSDKLASIDPATGTLVMPQPCPDWSQPQSGNFQNTNHSNYGCAVNRNMALQLDDPQDLERGQGSKGTDTLSTINVIEQYRTGKLPLPMSNISTTGSSSQ